MMGRTQTDREGQAVLDAGIYQNLPGRVRGELLLPEMSDYHIARAMWNGMFDRRPAAILRCKGVADVIDAVNLARENDLLVSVRGGGHNVAGHAVCDGGFVIDLSPMRSVWLDLHRGTVRVEGGAIWREVDRETQEFGLATPGGLVSDTGVAGLTLGAVWAGCDASMA
ncbi:MAG: FAD-binding oxidoreductase [Anaerolineae bacterium]